MPTPVGIITNIGNTGYTAEFGGMNVFEKLSPHRCQIDQMARLSEIFLSDLQLHHIGCLHYLVKNRTIWFTWLEVKRAVLGLENDIVTELTV